MFQQCCPISVFCILFSVKIENFQRWKIIFYVCLFVWQFLKFLGDIEWNILCVFGFVFSLGICLVQFYNNTNKINGKVYIRLIDFEIQDRESLLCEKKKKKKKQKKKKKKKEKKKMGRAHV
eukprot:TRINITY_DN1239_c0_g2_i3.p7 TRINITY_DN1239_c0_g2~~TRINITY_DN1239_c0_g2_i3.p7  ORF type:complete len:121 (+),score=19.01 TRINITY_DN1239_c0_g2_i3:1287-1649(+)